MKLRMNQKGYTSENILFFLNVQDIIFPTILKECSDAVGDQGKIYFNRKVLSKCKNV